MRALRVCLSGVIAALIALASAKAAQPDSPSLCLDRQTIADLIRFLQGLTEESDEGPCVELEAEE